MIKMLLNKLFIFILTVFVSIGVAFAVNEDYQNNLNSVDVKKTGDKSLNVTLYTDSQYKEPLKVIKKTDTQYVLLLPETSNSANGSVANDLTKKTDGLVKGVELKHYSYPTGNLKNGYTKVTINTSEPVGLSASTAVQSGAVSKTALSEPAPASTPAKTTASKPKIRTEQATVKQTEAKEPAEQKAKAQEPKIIAKPMFTKTAKNQRRNIRQQQPVKKVVSNPAPQVANVEEKPIQLEPKPEETPVETEETAVVEEKDIADTEVSEDSPFDSSIEYESAIKNTLKSKWRENENLILAIFAILLVPLLIISQKIKKLPAARVNNKTIKNIIPKKAKKKLLRPTKYQQNLINIMDNSNLSWQERYNLLKQQEKVMFDNSVLHKDTEEKQQPKAQPEEQAPVKTQAEKKEKTSAVPKTPKQIQPANKSKIQGHLNLAKFIQNKNGKVEPQAAPSLISQVQISSNKGFYLTKFEDQTFLIGYVDDNVFVIKKFGDDQVSSLQARLNEKRKSGERYLVKAGGYKALVEVADDMKLVLEM